MFFDYWLFYKRSMNSNAWEFMLSSHKMMLSVSHHKQNFLCIYWLSMFFIDFFYDSGTVHVVFSFNWAFEIIFGKGKINVMHLLMVRQFFYFWLRVLLCSSDSLLTLIFLLQPPEGRILDKNKHIYQVDNLLSLPPSQWWGSDFRILHVRQAFCQLAISPTSC